MPSWGGVQFHQGEVIDPESANIGSLTIRELIMRPFKQTDEDRERQKTLREQVQQGREQARRRLEDQEKNAALQHMRLRYGMSFASLADTSVPVAQEQPGYQLDGDSAQLFHLLDSYGAVDAPSASFTLDSGYGGEDLELGLDLEEEPGELDEAALLGLERVDEGDMTAGLNRVPVGITYSATAMARHGTARVARRHDSLRPAGGGSETTANSLRPQPFTWTSDDVQSLSELVTVLGPVPSLLSTVFNYRRLGPNWLGTQTDLAQPPEPPPDTQTPRAVTPRDIALFIRSQSRLAGSNKIKAALAENQSGRVDPELSAAVYEELRTANIDAEPPTVRLKRELTLAPVEDQHQALGSEEAELSSDRDTGLPPELAVFSEGQDEIVRGDGDSSVDLASSGASIF